MNAPATDLALLRSDTFRKERQDEWERLEELLTRMEKGRLRRLSDEDVLAMPALYRTAASSLAVARETSLDAATIAYLEALVQRAWFQVYGPRIGLWRWLRDFLGGGWPARLRQMWLDICIAFAVMFAGTLVGWLLCAGDDNWFYRLVPAGMAGGRGPDASPQLLSESLFGGGEETEGLSLFATSLFSNNAGVSILAFALGFAFGIPTLLLLLYNTALLGAMLWLFFRADLGWDFVAWLSVHGTTELTAIMLAGAAGLHIGRTMAFPGNRAIMAAAKSAGVRAAVVMVGVVIMMSLAAVLEGYVRQLVTDTATRFVIGGSIGALWLAYFVGAGRGLAAKSGRAGDTP